MKWLYNMSLRKKFYGIFGLIILGSIVGIIIGQIAFQRVQIGGRFFKGIEIKRDTVDELARVRMNLNFIKGIYLSQIFEYDEDLNENMKNIVSSTDTLFTQLEARETDKNNDGGMYCTSCHALEHNAFIFTDIKDAQASWNKFKPVLLDKLVPLVASGKIKSPDAEFSELFGEIMEKTKTPIETMRSVSPLQVEKLKKDSNIIRMGFIGGGRGADDLPAVCGVLPLGPYRHPGHFRLQPVRGHGGRTFQDRGYKDERP